MPTNRTKKSTANVTTVIKKEIIETPDKPWDEEIDAYDYITEEGEDGEITIKKVMARRRKKTFESTGTPTSGKDYHLDIWFLISEFIRPEDVSTFARICKTSFAVVCTAKFWFGLYKRYYKTTPNMPEQLQPQCLLRFYGVRTSVIRALHFMYTPFTEKLIAVTTFEQHPDILIKRQCVTMWHESKNKQWLYYFKLKENLAFYTHNNSYSNGRKLDLLEMLEDISANPDENCRILLVTCKDFISLPIILGYTLTSVSLNLSQGLHHHRLQLGFSSSMHSTPSVIGGKDNPIVHLDPVINIRILDWWHPLYPHVDNMDVILNVSEEAE